MKAVIYIHGKGGNAGQAEHFIPLFPHCDVIGFDYVSDTPWEAKAEFSAFFDRVSQDHDSVIIIADSIGAFFAMNAFESKKIETAYFISPVADMERLITDMMKDADVTEDELRDKKEVGALSWAYLCYVRENPIKWTAPTHILYGENDRTVPFETVARLADDTGATLTVMAGGEHWFHTDEQMAFLDRWMTDAMDRSADTGYCPNFKTNDTLPRRSGC